MLFAQFGNLFDVNGALKIVLGTYLNIVAAGNICLQVDLFVDYSEHDFSVGPSNCCARRESPISHAHHEHGQALTCQDASRRTSRVPMTSASARPPTSVGTSA